MASRAKKKTNRFSVRLTYLRNGKEVFRNEVVIESGAKRKRGAWDVVKEFTTEGKSWGVGDVEASLRATITSPGGTYVAYDQDEIERRDGATWEFFHVNDRELLWKEKAPSSIFPPVKWPGKVTLMCKARIG